MITNTLPTLAHAAAQTKPHGMIWYLGGGILILILVLSIKGLMEVWATEEKLRLDRRREKIWEQEEFLKIEDAQKARHHKTK